VLEHRPARDPTVQESDPCPKMTELASGAIMHSTPSQSKLGDADETPAIVIVGWPAKGDRLSPVPFNEVLSTRLSAAANAQRDLQGSTGRALPKGMTLAVVKRRQRWAPLLELPLVISTVVALRGRNLEPRSPVKAACRRAT
jgi:hypothetical protein